MATYQDYKALAEKIDAVAKEKGISILYNDQCVDIENAGSDDDYDALISVACTRFGFTCEDYGLRAQDYGISY